MLLSTLKRLLPLLLLIASLSSPLLARPAAMVTEVLGSATASGRALQLFDTLEEGQVLVLPAGASLTLSYLEGGLRGLCQGPARYQVQANGLRCLQGKNRSQLARPAPGRRAGVSGDFNWDRMAGLRREDLGWTGDRAFVDGSVELRWQAPGDLDEVEIVVEQLPDFQRVFKGTLPARPGELRLQLQPGQRYQCHLRGFSPRRTAEAAEWSIRTLNDSERAELHEREQASQGSPCDRVEHCGWLLQQGLQSRAQKLARELLEKYPGQERLRQLARPE